jgi:sugar/nucleoside kinase (ribokinase family)
MSDILTIGDSNIDVTLHVNKVDEKVTTAGGSEICFIHGTKIPVESITTSIAGNAVNVGVGCNFLGLKASVYTEIGADENGQRIIKELTKLGIDTKYCVKSAAAPTDIHSIIVFNKERTIFSYHGKRNYKIRDWEKPKLLYYTSIGDGFQSFQDDLIKYIKTNKGIGIVFNPGTYQLKAGVESLKSFMEVTDILILNMEEAAKIVGEKPLPEIHIDLQKLGPKLTVITDGKNGVSAFDGKNLVNLNAYDDGKPVVDKTGAGDAFSSGFVSAIFHKRPLKEALAWGVVNAQGEISVAGTDTGLYTKDKMENLVNKLVD